MFKFLYVYACVCIFSVGFINHACQSWHHVYIQGEAAGSAGSAFLILPIAWFAGYPDRGNVHPLGPGKGSRFYYFLLECC